MTGSRRRLGGWARPVLSLVPLARMHGPVSGRVRLPASVYSSGLGPGEEFDLDDESSRREVYEIVLAGADAEQAAELLDAGELLRLWPSLWLPTHVRRAWDTWLTTQQAAAATGDGT